MSTSGYTSITEFQSVNVSLQVLCIIHTQMLAATASMYLLLQSPVFTVNIVLLKKKHSEMQVPVSWCYTFKKWCIKSRSCDIIFKKGKERGPFQASRLGEGVIYNSLK